MEGLVVKMFNEIEECTVFCFLTGSLQNAIFVKADEDTFIHARTRVEYPSWMAEDELVAVLS